MDPMIVWAIAYHDAVYVGGAADNEAKSADLWLEVSRRENLCGEADRLWVADTIRATADHLGVAALLDIDDPRDHARLWVLDLDLTPLGEEPIQFDRNMELLEEELTGFSQPVRRAKVLDSVGYFAKAGTLYRCPELRDAFEAKAHSNLDRHARRPDESVS